MSALIRDGFFPIEERGGGQIFVTWKHLCRKIIIRCKNLCHYLLLANRAGYTREVRFKDIYVEELRCN
jgi:hypothetical protein